MKPVSQQHESYPLEWPVGWRRQPYREKSKFKTSFIRARDFIFAELNRMCASHITLSTNLNLRRDGLPLANQPNPKDPGAAVYFTHKQRQMVLACDQFSKIEENIYAIGKTIEALRGIERWGASDMMERAFSGFKALPASTVQYRDWRDVFNMSGTVTVDEVQSCYKSKMREHQNNGTLTDDVLYELNGARDRALKELRDTQ